MDDYRNIYFLEEYLLNEVSERFRKTGVLKPVDFFLILHWKAPRAKTRHRDRLKKVSKDGSFAGATTEISASLWRARTSKERLEILMNKNSWGFRLPTATAILTILYPEEFTVYDLRVRTQLDLKEIDRDFSDELWNDYQQFRQYVIDKTPPTLKLRDKDRYLWGRSLWEDAERDCQI